MTRGRGPRRDRRPRDRRPDVAGPTPPATRALLPVRIFFGATFVYAGFDKLLDPRFFDASNPASIQAQLLIFSRVSPIGGLIRFGQPLAVPIGLAIAVLEIGIGLGALSGLAFRAAAWAGALLSLLFFLTASWATRPFYYGADLPYAAGWIALALAGHGGLVPSDRLIAWASRTERASAIGAARGPARATARAATEGVIDPPIRDRRTVLQAAVLGVFALIAASFAVPFRSGGSTRAGLDEPGPSLAPAPSTGLPPSSAGPSDSAVGGPTASSSPLVPAARFVVAHVADLTKTGARAFTVPFAVPAPLPAGDPAVIVRLADGSFVAFDAVCTHAGCTVQWDRQDRVLLCPCHGAAFDPAQRGAVIQGPTNQPLAAIPLQVDAASGAISLRI